MSSRWLTPGRLMDYLEGRLDDEQEAQVVAALALAPKEVHDQLRWLGGFSRRAAKIRFESPPADLRRALVDAFNDVRRVLDGELLFDTRTELAGVRSLGTAERWSLIHTSELADVATDFVLDGDALGITGQVLVTGPQPVEEVQLWHADAQLAGSTPDPLGQFDLGQVDIGDLRLVVAFRGASLRIDLALTS